MYEQQATKKTLKSTEGNSVEPVNEIKKRLSKIAHVRQRSDGFRARAHAHFLSVGIETSDALSVSTNRCKCLPRE